MCLHFRMGVVMLSTGSLLPLIFAILSSFRCPFWLCSTSFFIYFTKSLRPFTQFSPEFPLSSMCPVNVIISKSFSTHPNFRWFLQYFLQYDPFFDFKYIILHLFHQDSHVCYSLLTWVSLVSNESCECHHLQVFFQRLPAFVDFCNIFSFMISFSL